MLHLNLKTGALAALLCSSVLAGPALADRASDQLDVAMSRETDFIDPIHTSSADSHLFGTLIFDTLMYADRETGEMLPSLATDWTWVDDTTVEFTLREGVTYQNGEPFNADDVVYTFGLLMDMSNGFRQQEQDFGNITEVEKLGDYSVRITLGEPEPVFANLLASRIVIWPDQYTAEHGHLIHATEPVGTGPYALVSMTRGSDYMLEANPDYFGGARPAPSIGNIRIRVIPETQTQIAEIASGGIDFAMNLNDSDLLALQGMPGIDVTYGQTTRSYFLSMETQQEEGNPMSNADVRRAISHAINKPDIVHGLISPEAAVLQTNCNPTQNYCLTDIEPTYGYDLEKARELMESAGYAEGFEVDLIAESGLRSIAEALQGELAKINIQLDLDLKPLPAWRTEYIQHESEMSIVGWGNGVSALDVSNSLGIFFNGSSTDYAYDPEIAAWTAEAMHTMDPAKREELYRNALTRINEEAYVVPLYGPVAAYVTSDDVMFEAPFIDFPDLSLVSWKD